MPNKRDPYYAALLVEDARLHLGTVMAGKDSEPFFMTMLLIVEAKVHFGYTTLRNKKVELSGIKDFIHNVYYGLGVRKLNDFINAAMQSALKERSKNRYAYNFIDWLKKEDEYFNFPASFFEYRRLMMNTAKNRRKGKYAKILDYRTIKFLYQDRPELLVEIGYGRKYKNVQECYIAQGYTEKKEKLKPVQLFRNPTNLQLEEAGKILFERFGPAKSRILAMNLLSHCADARAAGARRPQPAGDFDAGRPDWA